LRRTNPLLHFALTVGITAIGVWTSNITAEALDEKDPPSVVIDEVVGTLIAMGLVRSGSIERQLIALILFRVLDILKPGIIDRVQYAEPPGVGIMADDVLAGIAAGIIARWLPRRGR
jgi:phosphatidylglycerophosphatase A